MQFGDKARRLKPRMMSALIDAAVTMLTWRRTRTLMRYVLLVYCVMHQTRNTDFGLIQIHNMVRRRGLKLTRKMNQSALCVSHETGFNLRRYY